MCARPGPRSTGNSTGARRVVRLVGWLVGWLAGWLVAVRSVRSAVSTSPLDPPDLPGPPTGSGQYRPAGPRIAPPTPPPTPRCRRSRNSDPCGVPRILTPLAEAEGRAEG